VETELDLDDRSEWIRVERDLASFVGGQTSARNLMSLCLSYSFTSCSCSELDRTLDLNPRVYFASSCSRYFSKLHIV
jgi:hypothetical protein